MMALSFFTTNAWTFHNEHFLNLNKLLLPQDKESFDFDFRDIDPKEYFKNATVGAKKYLMKEPDELLPAAKLKAKK
jgi:fatty acyl-CoA reductase